MLNLLFPQGFILIAVICLALFVAGYGCALLTVMRNSKSTKHRSLFGLNLLIGVVLAFLSYHFMWHMICRQFGNICS